MKNGSLKNLRGLAGRGWPLQKTIITGDTYYLLNKR
jgi:hypothetical protein